MPILGCEPTEARRARGSDMPDSASKRSVAGPLLAVAVSLGPGGGWGRGDGAGVHPGVGVLYAGAADCARGRTWRRGAGAASRPWDEFARLTYREVEARTLFEVLSDEAWPDDLRAYRA